MKYKNAPTLYDGIRFDSKLELNRYLELCLLEKAGKITDLEIHPKFELLPEFERRGKKYRRILYEADFCYKQNGKMIVEDTKSQATANNAVYKLKKKMFHYCYPDLEIKEVYKGDVR